MSIYPLIDDPSKKRIIVDLTPNPAGIYSQVLNCIHVEVVDVNESSIALDQYSGIYFSVVCDKIAGLTVYPVWNELPPLKDVLKEEIRHKERNEY